MGSMATVAHAAAPSLGPARSRSSGGERHGDVAHVGDARLDDGREPDAVAAALGARGVTAGAQPGEAAVTGGDVEGGGVVAGVEK